jgi:hypothetical protein
MINFNFNNKKSRRKAEYLWKNILTKPKNYFSNLEEISKISFVELITYGLEVKPMVYIYPNKLAKQELKSLIRIFYENSEIINICSLETVYQSIKKELEVEIISSLESKPLRDFKDVVDAIFFKVSENIKNYDFYFSLEGIELVDIKEINLGSIQIFKFNETRMHSLIGNLPKQQTVEDEEIYRAFIEKNFLGRVCIKCSCLGDNRFSEKLARIRIREAINFFRYIICILFYQRIYENLLKINIVSETYVNENQILVSESNTGSISLQWGATRKNLEIFPINEERMSELKDKLYFDGIFEILNNNNRTEIEGCILTAMYWTGEAQNEFDWDIAFLKYWTALECIFSSDRENITHSLARGVSILAGFGGYKFIEVEEIDAVYKSVSNLYDKRSKIVHRGLINSVSEGELVEICKYASWTILSLLSLRSIGYLSISQLEREVVKLHESLHETD